MMSVKIYGAVLVMLACGSIGFFAAAYVRFEAATLKQYILSLEYMVCELQFRHTPLPELFAKAATICDGILGKLYSQIAVNLESQRYPSAVECFQNTVKHFPCVPKLTQQGLDRLSASVGAFDLQAQIDLIQAVKTECEGQQKQYIQNQDMRLRNYKTLGICAGTAIVILFI